MHLVLHLPSTLRPAGHPYCACIKGPRALIRLPAPFSHGVPAHTAVGQKLGSATALRCLPPDATPAPAGFPAAPPLNPLELLRETSDPRERARLLQQLDTRWSECSDSYRPSEPEACIIRQLGVPQYTVMMAAVAQPALAAYSVASQLEPAIRCLKAANVEPGDIWLLITQAHHLLADPLALQRWLDFLAVYQLAPRDVVLFLQRAPRNLFADATLAQAARVVGWLKQLGLRDGVIGSRVVCLRPEVLLRDVEAQLQPLSAALLALGLQAGDVGHMAAVYPELLLRSAHDELAPFVAYLRRLGCLTSQVAALLFEHPHLLQFGPEAAFGPRLASLQQLGVSEQELGAMARQCPAWLTAKGGVGAPLAALRALGLGDAALRCMVVRCPALLACREGELEARARFLAQDAGVADVAAFAAEHPHVLGAPLLQVLGPRHAFLQQHARCRAALVGSDGLLDWFSLVSGSDEQFCELVGAGLNELSSFRTQWEEAFSARLSRAAAEEFQEELRKLGIYEGS